MVVLQSVKRTRVSDVYDQNDVVDEDRMFEHLKAQHDKNSKEAHEKNVCIIKALAKVIGS